MDKDILKALYEGEVYPSEQLGPIPEEKEMMEMCDLLWHRMGMEDQKRLDHITDQFAVVCRGVCAARLPLRLQAGRAHRAGAVSLTARPLSC